MMWYAPEKKYRGVFYDVIYARKINIDFSQYSFFLVHITSYIPAEKSINVLTL